VLSERLAKILRTLERCVKEGYIRLDKDDEVTVFLVNEGLIKEFLTEDEESLYEVTSMGRDFLALVKPLKDASEEFLTNGNSSNDTE
jgi:predicted transcriptional regulator